MTISTTLFQEMAAYLTPLPCFGDENARRAFLLNAGLEEILTQVNCAGTPQTFVPLLLELLAQYGNFGEQPALCRLLDGVATLYGDDKKARFAEFCERIQAEQRAEQQANYAKYSRATPAQQADFDRKMALEREAERQRSERAQQSQQRSIGVKPNVEKLFVDREVYLAELTRAVADDAARLILIVGQGGMGKTALAAKFCDDLEKAGYRLDPSLTPSPNLGEGRGGVIVTPSPDSGEGRGGVSIRAIIYISRAELQTFTIDHVLRKLVQSLDAEANGRVAPILGDPRADATVKTEALLDALRDGLTLLVLDNFETLLDNGAIRNPDIAAFLETACATQHGLNIIITSRYDVPLAAFESVRHIHLNTGLRLPDAVGLLRRLGKTVESVCAAPDGELEQLAKAVHCVPMALKSLVGFLRSRPRVTVPHLLRDASRFAEFKRHDVAAGLRKLIAEQYSLLTGDQQLALQALAVFNAPVAPVAAQSLFPGLDADAALETLAYQLFLAQHNRVADEFDLHPSVREYAYEQLNPAPGPSPTGRGDTTPLPVGEGKGGGVARLHAKAADFYAQMKKPEAEWKRLPDVQPHLDEIGQRIAAGECDRAAEVLNEIDFDYLQKWGYSQIVMILREQLRGKLTDSKQIQFNDGLLSMTYRLTGRVGEAILLSEHAFAIARSNGDRKGESRWLGNLGITYNYLGETRQAIDYSTQALAIAREISDRHGEGVWLGNLGEAYYHLGETRQAIDYSTQALAIHREVGDRRGEAEVIANLGLAYTDLAEIEQAIEYYLQAIAIAQDIGDKNLEGILLGCLGDNDYRKKDFEHAIEYFEQALTFSQETGDKAREGDWLDYLGTIHLEKGLQIHNEADVNLAKELCQKALVIARDVGDVKKICSRLGTLGMISVLSAEAAQAAAYFQECLTGCDAALANAQLYEVLYCRAFTLLALPSVAPDSQPADAPLAAYQQALAVCAAAGVVKEAIHELERWQQICARRGLAAPLAPDALALLRGALA